MYCPFYGLSEKPFEVTPDPRYLYLSPSHREVLASLVYGIKERRGFIAITGEVGTGKTTLINAALERLDDQTRVAYICNTSVDFDQILHQVLLELGMAESSPPLSKAQSIQWLNDLAIDQLSRGGNVVLIVDEAQNLDQVSLENLRLLSNLETHKHKLIQIVLSGQPELDADLGRPELRQLAQRISVRRHVSPLTEKETYEYLRSRLNLSGCQDSDLFGGEAERLIYGYSGGVPRRINILCDNALLIGFGLGEKRIKAPMVEEAARDLGWSSAPAQSATLPVAAVPVVPVASEPRRIGLGTVFAAMFAFTACLSVGVWAFLTYSGYTLKRQEPVVVKQSVSQPTDQLSAGLASSNAFQTSPSEVGGATADPVLSAGPGTVVSAAVLPILHNTAKPLDKTLKPLETPVSPVQIEPAVLHAGPQEPAAPTVVRARTVTVGHGDTLYTIIRQAYGKYNKRMLDSVLGENPHISDPDRILTGQVIQLPEAK